MRYLYPVILIINTENIAYIPDFFMEVKDNNLVNLVEKVRLKITGEIEKGVMPEPSLELFFNNILNLTITLVEVEANIRKER